jgi:hypothetical protein
MLFAERRNPTGGTAAKRELFSDAKGAMTAR